MFEITIDLENSQDAKALDTSERIHDSEFEQVEKLIDQRISSNILPITLDNSRNTEENNAITILGTRGSGKTTFLKSIANNFEKNGNVCIIRIIDPTLIEEKGHIFLTLIAAITEKVEEKFKLVETNVDNVSKWEKVLNKLASGLPSMDGVGNGYAESDWQDPEYIMQRGLKAVTAALDLRNDFNTFINTALDMLRTESTLPRVFLVFFDDIDVDFRKGFPVLEMIRKYFNSSAIIPIVSGDLHLYSLSIRKQKWKNFGKALLINEGEKLDRLTEYNDKVTEMEGQYMLKVLKPEKRIHLTTLFEKTFKYSRQNDKNTVIKIKFKGEDQGEIFEVYKSILNDFGIANGYQAETYISFLLGLPIRTQIYFLLGQLQGNNNNFDPFLSDLYEKKINVYLIESTPKLINVEILKLLIREKELADSYQLQPTTTDMSLNASFTALSLHASKIYQQYPFLIFDYIIKIGLIRNLVNLLPYHTDEKGKSESLIASIEGLCKHAAIYKDKVLRDVSGNIVSYLKGAFPNNADWAGAIPLYSLAETAKQGRERSFNRIDRVFSQEQSKSKRILGFIPLTICASATAKQSTPAYSIFTLLATIGELVRKVQENDLQRGLIELSQLRSFMVPEFKKGVNEGNEILEFVSKEIDNSDDDIDVLSNEIQEWANEFPNMGAISTHVLGKITTRYFYANISIVNGLNLEKLGEMMHRRIIAFLNSVLIEDAHENISDFRNFNINNPVSVDDIFLENLKATKNLSSLKSLRFSRWLLGCPLLLCYLNPYDSLKISLSNFTGKRNMYLSAEMSVYQQLNNVSVRPRNSISRDKINLTNENLIKNLIENKVLFSLFELTEDKGIVRQNNAEIRRIFKNLLNDDTWGSTKIRNLRRYIDKNNISW